MAISDNTIVMSDTTPLASNGTAMLVRNENAGVDILTSYGITITGNHVLPSPGEVYFETGLDIGRSGTHDVAAGWIVANNTLIAQPPSGDHALRVIGASAGTVSDLIIADNYINGISAVAGHAGISIGTFVTDPIVQDNKILNYTTCLEFDITASDAGIPLMTRTNHFRGCTTDVDDGDAATYVAGDTITTERTPNFYYAIASTSGAVTMTSTPTVAVGDFVGQVLILQGSSATDTLTLQDEGTLPGSNLRLDTTTRLISNATVLTLVWNGTDWEETAYRN